MTRLAHAISPEDAQLYYQIALAGRRDLNMAPEPRIGFEMTLLRMLAFRPDAAPAQLAKPASRRRPRRRRMPPRRRLASGPAASQDRHSARGRVVKRRASRASTPANWPAVVEAAGLSGMVRQLALNCVPAGFETQPADVDAR